MAPRQTSTTSNLSRFANRLSVANLSIAQKQIAPTTTIIKTPIKTEIMAPSLCCRLSFRLRLRLINASPTKLCRPLGKAAPALVAFFERGSRIAHLLDRVSGKLLRARATARFGDRLWRQAVDCPRSQVRHESRARPSCRSCFCLYGKPDLDQPAGCFRQRGQVGLVFGPVHDGRTQRRSGAETHHRIAPGGRPAPPLFWFSLY